MMPFDDGKADREADEELLEKDFIDESAPKSPLFLLMWGLAFISFVTIFWGVGSWYNRTMEQKIEDSPFLQVTNRELSVFLWHFSDNMPQHVKDKLGYLPAFEYQNRIGIRPEDADDFCQAPPELLFLYHTWDRLLSSDYIPRPIPKAQFVEFLEDQPEWSAEYWSGASEGYQRFLRELDSLSRDDLSGEPEWALPKVVRQAFQGWKNYKYEGQQINDLNLKYAELQAFMRRYPHYARNFWRNILIRAVPTYLLEYTYAEFEGVELVPDTELSPFLKVALFNFLQAQKGQ